jgi:predicted NodU family carbamoyl transferase
MRIVAFKPGHDGSIAALEDGVLSFSVEAEKDSFPRYEVVTPALMMNAFGRLQGLPDVMAVGGWVKGWHSVERPAHAGYYGHAEEGVQASCTTLFGRPVHHFSSTHERSHLMGVYGMSPFPQGEPVYVLVWEGNLGDFYEIDAHVRVRHLGHVMTDPGNKYSYLFALGDPGFPSTPGAFRFSDAGKLMALAAFSDRSPMTEEERRTAEWLLARDGIVLASPKGELDWSPFRDVGVQSPAFKNLAGKYSDLIFERFHDFARQHLTRGYPLLIAGGCGLNCEWNSRWLESGLFSDVFVPPCTNDSGSAIGTAVDAQRHYTGQAKIEWSVYAGEPWVHDVEVDALRWQPEALDFDRVAEFLAQGQVIAWAQGRYEIGPRALGNRSILAAPFTAEMTERLNAIKQREGYRPIAPICLEEDADRHFECVRPSPHMLYFHRVRDHRLKTVTHVDGSARAQTVSERDNAPMHRLLRSFRDATGAGVLCNTSLNFNGRGFINRTSDLVEYCTERGLDGFAIGDRFYVRRQG